MTKPTQLAATYSILYTREDVDSSSSKSYFTFRLQVVEPSDEMSLFCDDTPKIASHKFQRPPSMSGL